MRQDLLAISDEDLVALSSRGTVKRIQKELERGDPTAEFVEEAGSLRVLWSDDVECVFAAGETLEAASCTCDSGARMCRHLLRTVMAYREFAAADTSEGAEGAIEEVLEPWDPGEWPDEERSKFYPEAEERRAQRLWGRGLAMELHRGVRPTARFYRLGHRVRFVVPGSPAGAVCDCTEESPCIHVLLAVRGFQELPQHQARGVVAVGRGEEPLNPELMERATKGLEALVDAGVSSASVSLLDRLGLIAEELGAAGAIWLQDILEELARQVRSYEARDARFSAEEVGDLVGEFQLRSEAGAAQEPAVPRFFLVGHKVMGSSTLGPATLLGLGTMARWTGKSVELLAMAADSNTGRVVALSRWFEAYQGEELSQFGRGQRDLAAARLIVEKVRVSKDLRLKAARRALGLYEQDLKWETLPESILVASFEELKERLELLAPSSLRPRRVGENFFVVAVDRVRDVHFSARTQALHGRLVDAAGDEGELYHEYNWRARSGLEALQRALESDEETPRFIAGHVERVAGGFRVEPTAVILEGARGRRMLQPWVDGAPREAAESKEEASPAPTGAEDPPELPRFLKDHRTAVGDGVVLGSEQALLRSSRQVLGLLARAEALGLGTFVVALRRWSVALERRDRDGVVRAVLANGKLARWARDC